MSSHPAEGSPIPKAFADAWRQCAPGEAEGTRAYSRFLGRPRPRKLALGSALAWLVAGMLIGVGTLQAAVSLRLLPARSSSSPLFESGRRAPSPVARVVGSGPSTAQARPQPPPADSAANAPVPPRPMPKGANAESWQRVARGMRESDLETADDALLKLSRQGSEAEREVAKLVRAQVLLRQGRDAEARALLTELSRGAASNTTRHKAERLLEQMAPVGPSHRSFEPEPGTKAPR